MKNKKNKIKKGYLSGSTRKRRGALAKLRFAQNCLNWSC